MTIARSTGNLGVGTDETTLSSGINSGSTLNGTEVDLLGDNASVGEFWVYVVLTSTVTAGTVDVTINQRRLTTQAYKALGPQFQIAPTNGTQKIPLGKFPAARFQQVDVKNNGTGASCTISVLYELEKLS